MGLGALGADVEADECDCGAEVFDKVEAGAGYGKEVVLGGGGAEGVERGVVLEEEVELEGEAADVGKDGGVLEPVGVGTEAVESRSVSPAQTPEERNLHVMIINLANTRNTRPGLPQERLIKMARIIMEIRIPDLLLMAHRPRRIFPILLALDIQPVPQNRQLFPNAISINLIARRNLCVEASNVNVLLQDVFPHVPRAAETTPLIPVDGG